MQPLSRKTSGVTAETIISTMIDRIVSRFQPLRVIEPPRESRRVVCLSGAIQ